jgi:hypothetical protein
MLQVHGGRKALTLVDAMKYMYNEGGVKVTQYIFMILENCIHTVKLISSKII